MTADSHKHHGMAHRDVTGQKWGDYRGGNNFDAARYTISVRKETTEDGVVFVARVAELPDVAVHAKSATEAYEFAIDVVQTSKAMFDDDGQKFPEPGAKKG